MASSLLKQDLPVALRRWGLVRFLASQRQLLTTPVLGPDQRQAVLSAMSSARQELVRLPPGAAASPPGSPLSFTKEDAP